MKKGFTLIEVMFALFILLVGVTSVIQIYGTSATITKSVGDLSYAQNLGKTWLNRQLARNATFVYDNPTCIAPTGVGTSVTYNNTNYTVSCRMTKDQVNEAGSANKRVVASERAPAVFVKVRVTWTDNLNRTVTLKNHSVVLAGLLTKK